MGIKQSQTWHLGLAELSCSLYSLVRRNALQLSINTLFFLLFISFFSLANEQPKELEWEDLVPKDFVVPNMDIEHIGQAMAGPQTINAPVVKALDGQFVKIPGFVVPLEGDDDVVTEFLLVPYFGACVHVPPPPSNQLIHVTMPKGAPVEAMYDPIYVIGKIKTESWKGELAQVGYTMEGTDIASYDDF